MITNLRIERHSGVMQPAPHVAKRSSPCISECIMVEEGEAARSVAAAARLALVAKEGTLSRPNVIPTVLGITSVSWCARLGFGGTRVDGEGERAAGAAVTARDRLRFVEMCSLTC